MTRAITATVASLLVTILVGPASVASGAQVSWWHVTSTARPTYLAPGGEGEIVVTATNLGYGGVQGERDPVAITDTLPAGLEPASITGESGAGGNYSGPVSCSLKALTCTFAGVLRPYGQLEVDIRVKVREGAAAGGLNAVHVTGGETRSATIARPVTISEEEVPFGLQDNELAPEEPGGGPDTQAGSHPFQLTNTLVLNQELEERGGHDLPQPVALSKNISVKLPPGLIGNPQPFPRCALTAFLTLVATNAELINLCPPQTAVGIATVGVTEPSFLGYHKFTVPVFNLEPSFGEPARFGFFVGEGDNPVYLEPSLRSGNGEDYGITITSPNITQTISFLWSEITFWGVPTDPRHDGVRGYGCLLASRGTPTPEFPCSPLDSLHPESLLTLPTTCSGAPMASPAYSDSWVRPELFSEASLTVPMPELDGCNRLSFSPTISSEPSTDRAAAPSGLDFNVNFRDEGLTSPEGLAQSQLNKTVVTLPEGFTINPSAGVGLGGCSPEAYASESLSSSPGSGCPNDSKLGTVEIETPLLSQKIHGSLYIAQPYDNPFSEPDHPHGSLVALYIVARNAETGVLVKLAGKVTPNPVTGRLVTTFENNPQLPFDRFNFHFREGQQAPLITPATCGVYTTVAELTPWSEPATVLTDTSSFTLTKGFDGGPCPSGGVPPFAPGIESGTLNNSAGSYTPLYVRLTRSDADQEIAGFSTDLPPGLTGNLTGIPFCPEADIEAARAKGGAEEEAVPSCPAASQIGHTLVGTGVGAVLAYVPGRIYLAGPFDGAPFSVVSITSAKVGPFDLGTVVLRFGLEINPITAQVSVSPSSSEPIPTIIKGIVTHVRDIRIYIDRPNFLINPTSCNSLSIASTLSAHEGASATVTSPFQAASCANLQFAPKFAVSTSAKATRTDGTSLTVKLAYPNAPQGTQANIRLVKVELPRQLPSRLPTLQKACTAAQFRANPAGCPAASVIGHARVVTPLIPQPLEGPAYFVSNGGEGFPNLVMVLQGYGVRIDLVGDTFISKQGITSSTFKTIPDQPVGSFELTLPAGPYSALAALGNPCKQKLVMPTQFIAQNGDEARRNTRVSVTGCPKSAHAKHRKKHAHPKKGPAKRRHGRRK